MKFVKKRLGKNGWTRWQTPVMQGYLMKCCGCGLVHEWEYKALKIKSVPGKNGYWEAEELPIDEYRIAMRARYPKDT